jgi:hypothetical protein
MRERTQFTQLHAMRRYMTALAVSLGYTTKDHYGCLVTLSDRRVDGKYISLGNLANVYNTAMRSIGYTEEFEA